LRDDPDVAVMSCWGLDSRKWPEKKIQYMRDYLLPMHNHCGSLLKRSAWALIEPHVSPLLERMAAFTGAEYFEHHYAYLREKIGLTPEGMGGGWDEFYRTILHAYGLLAVSTPFRLLRHIGENGLNNASEVWRKLWSPEALSDHEGMFSEHPYLDKNYVGFWCQRLAHTCPDWKEKSVLWNEYRIRGTRRGPRTL
jgi:hypothetical protein